MNKLLIHSFYLCYTCGMRTSTEISRERATTPAGGAAALEKRAQIEKKLIGIIHDTYAEVARQYGEHFMGGPGEIYWQNACQQFSEILRKKLKDDAGIASEFEHRDVKKLNPNAKHHMYVSASGYLIDGTWQQFLEMPRKDNHFLMLNKDTIVSDLRKAKVPEELWFIYGVT